MSHEDRSMWEDPDESPAVRQLLRAGRSANSEYDVASGLARHLANIQAGAPVPAWAAAPQSTGSSLLAWLLPPIIGASVIGTWLWIRPAEPAQPTLTPTAAAVLPSDPQPSAAKLLPPLPLAPASAPRQPASVSAQAEPAPVARYSASARAVSPAANKHAALSSRSARRAQQRDSSDAEPREREVRSSANSESAAPIEFSSTPFVVPAVSNVAANSSSESRTRSQEPAAREAEQEVRSNPKEQAQAELAPPKHPAPTDIKLEREMQMLAVAQRVLVDDPTRALKLARQGEQEFRGSMFSAERKQVSLLALVQLGRLDEARRLGRPFLRAYPNAPWSARLREALATGQLPTR